MTKKKPASAVIAKIGDASEVPATAASLPDAAAIIAQVRRQFFAAAKIGADAGIKSIVAGLAFADEVGKIDVGVRLAAGEELTRIKRDTSSDDFAAACEETGLGRQRASEYIRIAGKFKSSGARTFAETIGWNKCVELVKLDESEINELAVGRKVRGFKSDAIVKMSTRQIRYAFADEVNPRIARLEKGRLRDQEQIKVLSGVAEQLERENAKLQGGSIARSKAHGFDVDLTTYRGMLSSAESGIAAIVDAIDRFGGGKRLEEGCNRTEAADARRLAAQAYCEWRGKTKKAQLAFWRDLDKRMLAAAELPAEYDVLDDVAAQFGAESVGK